MTGLILDWPAACAAGAAGAGGKGFQLGLLAALGLPVPPGFVIHAAASRDRQPGDPVPAPLAATLAQALEFRGWIDCPLAVRSSASQEDSARASFAGIHRSCLNVRGRDAVLQAVQDVWDSQWTPAAEAYRQRLGLDGRDAAMAVVVMPLLPAVAAGIAFTCDPVSGRDDQLVIHANWGLGESLVGGQAEGDEYRLQERYPEGTLELVDQRCGSKSQATLPAEDGGTELRDASPESAARMVLSSEHAVALGERVREAASAIDYAQPWFDVEWVWDGTSFWIVQARPITARVHRSYPALVEQPVLWSRGNSRDVMPDPLSPMDWSLVQALLDRMLTRTSVAGGYPTLPGVRRSALRRGRLYFDTSLMQWEVFDGFGVSPASCNQLLGGHQAEIRVPAPSWGMRLRWMQRGMRFVLCSVWPRLRARATLARAHKLATQRRACRMPAERAELARQLRAQVVHMRRADDLFLLQAAGSALFVLLDCVEKYCPGEGHALTAALMAGGEPSVTAMQGYALMDLAGIAAGDSAALAWLRCADRVGSQWSRELPEKSPFRHAFAVFLDRYGHRAVYESYLRNPRWREAPDYLFDSVLHLMDCDRASLRARQREASAHARQRVSRAMPWLYRPVLSALVHLATAERTIREAARSALTAHAETVRRFALALGESLAGSSLWRRPEDVFNLTLPELLAVAESRLPVAVAARRAAWRERQVAGFMRQADPEVVVEYPGVAPSAAAPVPANPASAAAGLWQGITVGSGQASGVAHVARHPTQALEMEAGAILVVPSTDPSWTPAFLKAGALVMETGGYLSHGAIVAREFGIPAVANLPGILDAVGEGELLEVNANRGTVRRVRAGERQP